VLYQLTGDEKWLLPPYRPSRARGMDDHASGGYDEQVADAIRAAAFESILAWHGGLPAFADSPGLPTIGRMLECFLGESVPEEYWQMFGVQLGFLHDPADVGYLGDMAIEAEMTVAIIGAGISGMYMGMRLKAAGVPFRIFERASDVGGVWLQNKYPGAGVDTPSNLYSFPHFPADWSVAFARRSEVIDYLRRFALEHDLRNSISFETTVETCSWDSESASWDLVLRNHAGQSESFNAQIVISAVGLFKEPAVPDLPGLDRFRGEVFHSSHCPEAFNPSGRRVAVVGSGASAMQVVPAIADEAAHVVVLQRTAQWIAPVAYYFDRIPSQLHWLRRHVPYYFQWCRTRTAWNFNDKNYPALVMDPTWESDGSSVSSINEFHRKYFLSYIESKLADRPDLKAKAVPTYPPYGKRILLDNGWYDALLKPTVQLETEGIAALTESAVVSESGRSFDVDCVILCTGFQTTRYLYPIEVRGRDRARLECVWGDDDASSYLGMSAPQFPNFFFMYGPGSNAGGGSFLSLAESWIRSIMQILAELLKRDARTVEPRAEVVAAYNSRMDEANASMVWSHPGMTTYVRNRRGRVTVNMPWRIVDYWLMTANPQFDSYLFG